MIAARINTIDTGYGNFAYEVQHANGRFEIFDTVEEARESVLASTWQQQPAAGLNCMHEENYLDYVWKTRNGEELRLGDMARSHVHNTLQWCLRKQAAPDDEKDNIPYSQWIAFFTRRLLDPEFVD